jgi:hypothetical protein
MEAKKARGHALSNGYMEHDTAEIPVISSWMPTMTADLTGQSHDGASSTLSQ